MRRDNNQQKIVLAVGIALSAGVFSIMPSASAAPVLDHVVSGGAVVDQKTTPNVTDVTSTTRNNVVDWKDFSVAQGETVRFDGGEKINNYLNVVSGANTSHIDGAIKGGNNVYIVNPNGVVFGSSASVDVGSLYVSTRPLDTINYDKTDANGDMQPLADTASMSGGDIVNMGTVQANSVFVEGGNIILADVDRIKTADGLVVNNNVTIQTNGNITLGRSVSAMVEEEKAGILKAGKLKAAAGRGLTANKLGANYNYTANNLTSSMGAIYNETDLDDVRNNLAGSYQMMNDVAVTSNEWTPIGDDANAFTGNFDGQYYTVSGIKVSSGTYGGLFGYTDGATIENVGVKDVNITADYAGGIAGRAKGTTFTNVFNAGGDGAKITPATSSLDGYRGQFYAGGIVGYAENGSVSVAYNEANTTGGGIVGWGTGTLAINNAYNTNTDAKYGILASSITTINLTNVFTKGNLLHPANAVVSYSGYHGAKVTSTSSSDYTALGTDLSNSGSDNTVWRIYEGQTTPLLRAFLRRGGNAVTVNYSYTHGEQSGSNGGQELTADSVTADGSKLVYNGEYMTVTGTPSYSGVDNINSAQISYSNSGETGVKNAKTKALFYTGQQGYDLIGNNVTMAKRELNIAGQTLNYTHVYNGSADVTDELKQKIESGSAVGGIVAADSGTLKLSLTNFSAAFVNDAGVEDANAADDYKKIKLGGTISLGKAEDSVTVDAVTSAMENYTFTGATGEVTDATGKHADLSGKTAYGKISRRTLYLTQQDDVSITKVYDGDSSVDEAYAADAIFSLGEEYEKGDTTSTSGKIAGDDVSLIANDDELKYYQTDGTTEAVNAGTWQVKYTGIALDGTAKDNYVLKYKNADNTETEVDAAGYVLSGTITPKLLDTSAFQVLDSEGNPVGKATKVYNGEVGYDVPDGTTLNVDDVLVERDKNIISFALATSGAYFADANGDATANVKDATQVKYKIQASTSDADHPLSNYKLSDDDTNVLTANAMTYAAAGEITRRNLQFEVKKDGIDKPYDGDSKVKGNDYIQIGGDYLDYADNLRLVTKDTENLEKPLTVEATYQAMSAANRAQDVYRVDGVVTDKTINYTIKMDASIAGNYTLNGQNAETPLTIDKIGDESIKGKITPLTITPEFNKITKTYDGSEAINTGDANASTYDWGTQLVDGDTVTLNYLTDKDHAYFTEADGTTKAQDVAKAAKVRYTGLSLDNGNYELSANELTGEGEITRRLIKKDGFTVNGEEASKVYDGTIYYTLPDGATLTALAEEDDNKGIVIDDQPHLKFKLSDDATKTYFTNAAGTETAKDVDTAEKVAYAVDATTDDGYEYLLGNYKLGTSDTDAVNLDDSTTGLHVSGAGHIDRRALTITAEGVTDINKTYDTTEAVKNENGSDYFTMGNGVKYGSNSKKLVSEEGTNDGTSWNIIATYNGADVYHRDNDPQKEVVNNGKDVTFKVYIEGDAAKNYTLNGQNAETYTSGNRLNLTGAKGTINQATITPVFNKITKNYTGTKAITDGEANASSVELQGNLDGNQVTLNYSTDEAHAYFADSQAGDYTAEVTYTGFSLEGAKSGNYKLASDTAKGDGEINKVQLNMSDFHFTITGVEKEYDTNVTIGNTATITPGDHYLDLGGGNQLNFEYTIAAGSIYTSKGTTASGSEAAAVKDAATGKDVHLTITITDPGLHDNYEYTFVANQEYDFTGVGTINPKKVYAKVNGPVEKTYDATTAVKSGDTTLTGDSLVNIVGKLDGTNETSAVYIDSPTGAGDAANYGIGNKYVKYTVKLDDASAGNYVIYDDDTYTTLASDSDKFTTNNNTINQRDLKLTFNPVTKVYDGYTSYGNSTVVNNLPAYVFDPDSLQSGDNLTVADGYKANASYNSANVKEAATVTYDKLTITGNDAGNYRLLDKDGNVMTADADGKYTTTGVGKISKYTLNSAPTITFEHVNKEYDGTNAVIYSRVPSENDPKKFINATVGTGDNAEKLGFDLVSALYTGGSSVNSDDGEHIRTGGAPNAAQFTIKFSSDNYEFSNINDPNFTQLTDGSYQYSATYDNATITPRTITVTLGDDLSNNTNHYVTKTYNGGVDVQQSITRNLFNFGADDVLSKTDGSKDKVYLAYNNTAGDAVQAEYDNKNAGDDKNVTYRLALAGDDAANYKLNTTTLTGKGDIQKAVLTIGDDTFDYVEKTYDGNANVTTLTAGKVHLTGVQKADGNNETINVANAIWDGTGDSTNKIIGTYDSPNVQWKVGTDEEAYQGVTYSNLQNALESMTDGDGEKISTNYTIDNTKYFEAAKGKGKIKAIAITQNATRNWTSVTREYNANDNVDGVVYAYDPVTGTKGDTLLNTNDILKLTVTDKDGNDITVDYTAAANFTDKNVGDDKTLNYTITGVDKKVKDGNGNRNYILSNDVYNELLNDPDGKNISDTNNQITKRQLNAVVQQGSNVTKVYDGTKNASADNFVLDEEDRKVLEKDGYNVAEVIQKTAAYRDENATISPGEANTNSLTIDYTMTTTADAQNYEVSTSSATATGDIVRRTLSLNATPVSVNVGESMPGFTGTITGFVGSEAGSYSDFINGVTFKAADGATTSTPGSYGVYGWYMGNKTGLLGQNYQFDQVPANATAFTVNYVNNNTGNPDTKITPNNSIYHQISKDMNSGFGDNGAAAIEYKDKSGKVLGTEKIDSGEINDKGLMIGGGADMSKQADSNANIGIAGGDIVNMEGANAAGSVNIETNGEGTVVNLEVFSIDEEKESGTNNSTAEITNMDSQNGMASIEIRDEKQNMLGEDIEDKKEEKEGKIAIKSSNGEDDEIELTVEKQGVNVA